MSVIIRLQNLPWTANALDIRRFFNGLTIPDGGVHIIGGEKGDAFIAFGSDEDARKAMLLDLNKINGTVLKLYLSSKTEMQNVIAIARGAPPDVARTVVQSVPSSTSFISQSSQGESFQTRQVNRQTPTSVYPNQPNLNPAVTQVSRPYVPISHTLQQNTFVSSSSGVTAPSSHYASNITVTAQSHLASNGNTYSNATNQQDWRRVQHVGRYQNNTIDYRTNTQTSSVPYSTTPKTEEKAAEKEENPAEAFIRANQSREYARRKVRKHSDGRPPSPSVPHPEEKGYQDYGANRKRDRSPIYNRSTRNRNSEERTYRRDDDKRNYSRYSPKRGHDERYRPKGNNDSRYRGVDREQDERQSDNVYVYLENMPKNQVSYSAVRKLFSGCLIPSNGMKLINNKYGDRNGCAYIQFKSEEDCQEALKLDGTYVGNRKIFVKLCLRRNFEDAVDSFTPNASGLKVSRQEPMDIPPKSIGAPYKGEFRKTRSPSPPPYQCVMLRNLPKNTEREDVFDFFKGLQIGGYGCYIEYDIHGKALGDGYVEFATQEDYQEALLLHKRKMNHQFIDIYPMSLDEIKGKVEKHKEYMKKEKERLFKGGFKKEGFQHFKAARKFDNSNTRQERDYSRDRERGQGDYYKNRDRSSREFNNDEDRHSRTSGHSKERRSRSQSSQRSRQKSPRKWEPPVSESQLIGDESYKHIKMSGIPFDCDESVIKGFFSGLNITEVKIIYDSVHHSAHRDGFVAFLTQEDCQKAKSYSMRYIGKRYIQIFPMDYESWRNEIDSLVNCNNKYLGTYPALRPNTNQQKFHAKGFFKFDKSKGPPYQLVIKNVPQDSAFRDLLELFKNYSPCRDKGNFNPDKAEGRLFFQDSQDAMDAVKDMNHRYVKGVPLVVFQPK